MNQDLLAALEDFMEARTDYRKCVDDCETSPGYWCQRLEDRVRSAEERFMSALDAYVAARITAALTPTAEPAHD